jgi:hypothetical protein
MLFTVQEYDGLTTKIHELQMREQELLEVLYVLTTAETAQRPGHTSETVFQMDIDHNRSGGVGELSTLRNSGIKSSPCSGISGDSKPPMKSLVKAYLPNKMKTAVSDVC